MPHQCTTCGEVFADGSKEMLSGCPDCGGNKFQFHPDESDVPENPEPSAEPPDPPGPDSTVARTVGNAAATVRDFVGGSGPPESPEPTADAGSDPVERPAEDTAQADARSQVVSPDEIPASDGWDPAERDEPVRNEPVDSGEQPAPTDGDGTSEADGRVVGTPDGEKPDLTDLREELNDQFESIKVLSPGQYELNLMELYDREEYIIALQEDGRYTIQVPETWHQ